MYLKFIKIKQKLFNHEGFKLYGTNIFYLTLEKIVRVLIGFLVGIYVARSLMPESYGIWNYSIAFVSMFGFFSLSYLDGIAIREILKNQKKIGEILGSLRILKIFSLLLMIFTILTVNYFGHSNEITKKIIFIESISYFFQYFQVLELYFQSQVKSKYVAISQIIAFIIISGLKVYLAYNKYSVIYFAYTDILYMVMTYCLYQIFFNTKSHNIKFSTSKNMIKFFLNNSKILLLSSIFGMICFRIEVVILKMFVSNYELGCYSVAMKIVELFYFVSIVFGTTFNVALNRSKKVSEEHYQHRLSLYGGGLIYLNILSMIALIIFAPLIASFYGTSYSGVAILIMLYATRLPVTGFITALYNYLVIENKLLYMTIYQFCLLIITTLFCYILSKKFGTRGSAISIGLSYLTILILSLFFGTMRDKIREILKTSIFYSPKNIIQFIFGNKQQF